MKAYLIVLEIEPVELAGVYDNLPLHCTLVHWFWLEDSAADEFVRRVNQEKFDTLPLVLTAGSQEIFTGMTKQGPIPVTVNTIVLTQEIKMLHEYLRKILDSLDVTYPMPQYIGDGYVPHITHQKHTVLHEGDNVTTKRMYIAEAAAPEYGNPRKIIAII